MRRTCAASYPVNVYIGTQKLTELNNMHLPACSHTDPPPSLYVYIYYILGVYFLMSKVIRILSVSFTHF
jgi:hypothetical protein